MPQPLRNTSRSCPWRLVHGAVLVVLDPLLFRSRRPELRPGALMSRDAPDSPALGSSQDFRFFRRTQRFKDTKCKMYPAHHHLGSEREENRSSSPGSRPAVLARKGLLRRRPSLFNFNLIGEPRGAVHHSLPRHHNELCVSLWVLPPCGPTPPAAVGAVATHLPHVHAEGAQRGASTSS